MLGLARWLCIDPPARSASEKIIVALREPTRRWIRQTAYESGIKPGSQPPKFSITSRVEHLRKINATYNFDAKIPPQYRYSQQNEGSGSVYLCVSEEDESSKEIIVSAQLQRICNDTRIRELRRKNSSQRNSTQLFHTLFLENRRWLRNWLHLDYDVWTRRCAWISSLTLPEAY